MSLKDFSKIISDFSEKAMSGVNEKSRALALEVFSAVVRRTPVGNPRIWKNKTAPPGYVGGRLRANWQVGVNKIPTGEVAGTGEPVIDLPIVINDSDVMYLANNLPYAQSIEYGHSEHQAPAGMVRITVKEFSGALKK